MLTPAYLMGVPEQLVSLWSQLEQDIIGDIVRRLVKTDSLTATAEWQMKKLREMRIMQDEINSQIVKMAARSRVDVSEIVTRACEDALEYDDDIYRKAGLLPTPVASSRALSEVIQAGINKTNGLMRNFTNTTAQTASKAFENALDRAYMQVQSGAFSYASALGMVIKEMGSKGITKIAYPTQRVDHMDVAARRALLTGLNQTTAELQLARMDEMECELVETTSHAGARPSHAEWQGQVFCRKGSRKGYDNFVDTTGYGNGDGLCGWNCYHSFFPYFEGLSTRSFERDPAARLGKSNEQMYEESQEQRMYERAVRKSKRECVALNESIKASSDPALTAALKNDFDIAALKLKQRESVLQKFCAEHGRTKLDDRGRVFGYNRSVAGKTQASTRKYSAYRYHKNGTIVVTDDWKGGGHASIPKNLKPFAVLETLSSNGKSYQIDRTFYDAQGVMLRQTHSGNHGQPKHHQYGNHGEHAHDYVWNANSGKPSRVTRDLTNDERRESADIL